MSDSHVAKKQKVDDTIPNAPQPLEKEACGPSNTVSSREVESTQQGGQSETLPISLESCKSERNRSCSELTKSVNNEVLICSNSKGSPESNAPKRDAHSNSLDWGQFVEGREIRLEGHLGTVVALADFKDRVYSGGKDDAIHVWNKSTLAPEGVLEVECGAAVWSMTCWNDILFSGHDDGKVRVWNLASGQCEQELDGHEDGVNALAMCGNILASASDDLTIRFWVKTDAGWSCSHVLEGHRGLVSCLAVWQDKVISGSWDDSIRVWHSSSGAPIKTLTGHSDTVMSLLVHRGRLLSASVDGTVRVWALGGGWAHLRTLAVYAPGAGQWVRCLAPLGEDVVFGSFGPSDAGRRFELQVWDGQSLERRRLVRLPEGQRVVALLGLECGAVWAGVGERWVAVWGCH